MRPDADVWAYAQAHSQTVITEDKDFANALHYPPPHGGVIISDLPDQLSVATQVQLILDAITSLAGQSFADVVGTVSPGRFRVRR